MNENPSLANLLSDYDNSAQIAERFKAAGIKAVPGDPCECAVAKYVKLYFATAGVFHDSDSGDVDYVVYADDEVFDVAADSPIGEFIRDFDAKRFPELIADGAV